MKNNTSEVPNIARLLVAAAALILLTSFCAPPAHAELQLQPAQCNELSLIAQAAAGLRDIGADVDKYLAKLRAENVEVANDVWFVIKHEIEQAFKSSEPPELVGLEVLKRCYTAEGKMGVAL